MDSRRFYAIRFTLQMNLPSDQEYIMASIWKGHEDGYRRMLGYRRKVGIYHARQDPHKWYPVRVECRGGEIILYFEDQFVCAVRDDEYRRGRVGVSSTVGVSAWRNLLVEGSAVPLIPPWSLVEAETPKQFEVAWNPGITAKQAGAQTTLLPGEVVLLGFSGEEGTRYLTRSSDYGLTWEKPTKGRFGYYLPSLGELWSISWEHNPAVTWHDRGTNFDELNMSNFWNALSRSTDTGQTWSTPERLSLPFPKWRAYQPIAGKAGSVLSLQSEPRELTDGSIAISGAWRNNPDGHYHSDQVQFLRTTDRGKTWLRSAVDATEWERNESTWVSLDEGDLLCVMRSNYTNTVGQSRSSNYGRTWSRVQPGIPFFGASAPALIQTRERVLVLTTRVWGIFTSTDRGYTWSLPTHIGGYTGSGGPANLLEMEDGRILILNATHGNAPNGRIKGQFVRVDPDGFVRPALPGPIH
jgi:hypothetical protein